MRLFGVQKDGTFAQYVQTPFQANHAEAILEDWLEQNTSGIVEDGKLLMIGRQVSTDLGGFVDLLALDRQGNVVVIELKRNRTPRETLAQALEYASFAEGLDGQQLEDILRVYLNDESVHLAEYHRQYFDLDVDEAVAFNKDQRIVIVGQAVTDEIRRTSTFLRKKGLRVTCVEFSFFEAEGGARLLAQDIVVGKEPARAGRVSSGSLPVVSQKEFLGSLDPHGQAVFERILRLAQDRGFPIHWGTKGFSLNVDLGGTHAAICYGYPPHAVFKQSLYTALAGQGGLLNKVGFPEEAARSIVAAVQATGLFQPAGRELKWLINRSFSEDEIASVLRWIEDTAAVAERYGLKE